MDRTLRWVALASIVLAGPAMAKDPDNDRSAEILQAIRLPGLTREARALGVPDNDLRSILAASRERRIPPGDLADIFKVENDAIRQHGPIDNFGAFVQGKLDSGLRGRDLAAAIQAEHGARGKGKGVPAGAGKSMDAPGKSGDAGKPADHGKSGDAGKPASPGNSGDAGKPANPGKSGDNGKKGGS